MAKATAIEKLNRKKEIKRVLMDKAYGGIAVGETMLVATPLIVDAFIRDIPPGQSTTIPDMRMALARKFSCDGTCPMSSAIFVRMSAEAALEELAGGQSIDAVAPFWRILKSEDKIAKRLDLDPDWIDNQRNAEGITA